jgi:hypothetical protein
MSPFEGQTDLTPMLRNIRECLKADIYCCEKANTAQQKPRDIARGFGR